MRILDIDVETYSEEDIKKVGAYKYVAHHSFHILLLAYHIDGVHRLLDLYHNPEMPRSFVDLLLAPDVLIRAHNWTFERLALMKHLNIYIPPSKGVCTMAKSGMLGLPLGLKEVGKVLKIKTQKDSRGEGYIRYFTRPCKPTKVNKGRTRNLPEHAPDAWKGFKSYNVTDVKAELGVDEMLDFFTVPTFEQEIYNLDQKINDRGVLVDKQLIVQAIKLDKAYQEEQKQLFTALTGIEKPKSYAQIKRWILDKTQVIVNSLGKEVIDTVRDKVKDYPEVLEMLDILKTLSKTSITKYAALYRMMGSDGRVRGLHQIYGAGRTGRWAGRGIQPHNLPRNKYKELNALRKLLRNGDFDLIRTFYDPSDVLSQLIRPSIIAPAGKILAITDFTSIEAVIISYLAGERWKLEAFRNKVDIYKATAAQMFNIPIEAVDDDYRQRGKVSELSLGFEGGVKALIRMGALKMGILERELEGLKNRWRAKNPAICKMWKVLGRMALDTVRTGMRTSYRGMISMFMLNGRFIIELPSGRWLVYHNARVLNGKVVYEGLDDQNRWGVDETYGGKITENIVQGIARDVLAIAMYRLDKFGYDIVMHVHDEIVMEIDNPKSDKEVNAVLDDINRIMALPIKWAKGAPISAKTFLSPFYKKD